MQTEDAARRRAYIESKGLGEVIFSYEQDDALCVQCHPKEIKGATSICTDLLPKLTFLLGGMIPELNSHRATLQNPSPITSRFSPWQACRPDYGSYSAAVKRRSYLHLHGDVCRLAPGDVDHEATSREWEAFGIPRSRDLLAFTNA